MKKRNLLWPSLILSVLILAAVGLQFVTGSLQFSISAIFSFLTTLVVVAIMVLLLRKRNAKVVVDERATLAASKANNMTFSLVIIGSLIASNITSALTPYYPELKVASTTLLFVIMATGLIRAGFYFYYDRKMS